jgi:hypothetical protein
VLERVVESPTPLLAEELEFSTLPAFEGCLDASDVGRPAGDGSSSRVVPIPPMSSLAITVVGLVSSSQLERVVEPFVPERVLGESPLHTGELEFSTLPAFEGGLGASDDGRLVEDGSASGAVLLNEPETTPQVSSVADFPLKEAQAESGWKSAPVMGLLRRGFLGPRSPSPASSSQGYKVVTVKDKGILAPVNGLIRRGFLGSNSDSSTMLVMSKVCSSPSAAPIDSVSKSQLAYSRRVKDKVAKQLHKYKEMLAKVVADSQVVGAKGYSKAVLDAMKFAPTMGMTWGDEDNQLLDLFSAFDKRKPSTNVSTPRVKARGSSKI